MKRSAIICCVLLLAVSASLAGIARQKPAKMIQVYNRIAKTTQSYPLVSIHDIDFIALDSLKKADSLQSNSSVVTNDWQMKESAYAGDTVVIQGLVVVPSSFDPPHHGITFTAGGETMLLRDPDAVTSSFSGILIRDGGDTAQIRLDGFNNVERGDVVQMTVVVNEFPTPPSNTATLNYSLEPQPIVGDPVSIISSDNPVPGGTLAHISDFYTGAYPGGTEKFSTGEQYQSGLVTLTNLKVNAIVNASRGTFQMVDSLGNYITDYDASWYFTLDNAGVTTNGFPIDSAYVTPPIGATVTSITGYITTVSGGENPRGYRICPLFPADLVLGATYPSVTAGKRTPTVVGPFDTTHVSCTIVQPSGGYPLQSEIVEVSINYGAWQAVPMTLDSTNVYGANILDGDNNPWPLNTNVRYFFTALDNQGNKTILANPSSSQGSDTSRGFYWYTVRSGAMTIHDVQYTPYPYGLSPYNGARVTVSGIVTAGDSDIYSTPLNNGGTSSWYIQSGSGPWNGIWVVIDSLDNPNLDTLQRGDSVSVSGRIYENFDVTEIEDSAFTIYGHNATVPAPVTITTGTFGNRLNGDVVAEPYEGTLIRVVNATVTNVYPIFSDQTEYEINDGSGPMLVRRDGVNSYSNIPGDTSLGKTILNVGDVIDTITGVGYFSFNRYKIVPRRNSDFSVGAPTPFAAGWNLISVGRYQTPPATGYNVSALFPTATTSAFSYANGYHPASAVAPGTGYWIKFADATTTYQIGSPISRDTVQVNAGWNLVGAIGSNISTSSIQPNPAPNGLSNFYGYNHGYVVSSTLTPWQGYWVKADSTGTLIMHSGAGASQKSSNPVAGYSSITFNDGKGNSQTLYFTVDDHNQINLKNFEMPPALAGGEFDARFASGRILETFPSALKAQRSFGVTVHSSTNAPMNVSWDIVGHNTMSLSLEVRDGSKVTKSIEMKNSGSAKGVSSASGSLALVVSGVQIPKEFSLSQNYPNPFNPSTRIDIGLPVAENLHVAVYNILGQKVATISDGYAEAGMHTLVWNGDDAVGHAVSTGVYFVRMSAGTFTGVKKMLLMK